MENSPVLAGGACPGRLRRSIVKILNQTRQTVIAQHGELADTPLSRLVGLLGRNALPEGHGLIITQTRSIHMFFMKFAIDVIFADRQDRVVGLVERIGPFRMSPYVWRASYAVELPAGTIAATHTQKGDQISWDRPAAG